MSKIHSAFFIAAAVTGFAAMPSVASAAENEDRWDGCSLGLETTYNSTTVTFPNAQPDQDLDGFMVGPALSCRMQLDNNLVVGAGARVAGGDITVYRNDGNILDQEATNSGVAALTLEVGYAFEDAYVFAEVGQVWYELEQREICPDPAAVQFGWCRPANGYAPYDLSTSEIEEGIIFGVGVEFALSENWSFGARVSYAELEGADFTLGPAANGLNLPVKHVEEHELTQASVRVSRDLWNLF
ncbi:MAG TPA: outer membrane beta-barrel protein [Candidatus Paceibacterota bacterium]|nr:outer membrane beta-barrel protein [Candidatus Paceibacterota bacterium]